jgi:hypothetical protein
MIEIRRIPYDEFLRDFDSIFEQIIREQETVVVENEAGEAVELRPAQSSLLKPEAVDDDDELFRSAAGSWTDMDTDSFLTSIYESRSRPSQAPDELD